MASRLHSLLDAWRRSRSEVIADELDVVSDRLAAEDRPRHPHELLTSPCTESELGALLAALPPVGHPLLPACLDRFWRQPVDPRLTTALQRLVLQSLPPSDDLPFWNRALALIAWVGDVRAADWLGALLGEVDGPALATRALVLRANELIVHLGRQPRPASRRCSTQLVVTAAPPSDPIAREVHADWLLERGDVRGELIILQRLDSPRVDQRRRTSELLRDYGRALLGRLSAALKPQGLRFDGGVVIAGQLSGYRALPSLVGADEWRTVEELDLRELLRRQPRGALLMEFLSHHTFGRLRVLRNFPVAELTNLSSWRQPLSVHQLHLCGWANPAHLQPLTHHRALPALQTLTLNGQPVVAEA